MPYGIDNETEEWFKGLEKKLYAKLKTQCLRLGSIMPYVPEHGCYYDMGARELTAWTNGFYAGMLWQMYHAFKEEEFRRAAEGIEERLDAALEEFVKLDHDVGFLWLHTAVATGGLQAMKPPEREASMQPGFWPEGTIRPDIISGPGMEYGRELPLWTVL